MQDFEHSVAPHVRRLRQRALNDRLRESLLFLPALMLVTSTAVGFVLAEIDERTGDRGVPPSLTFAPDVAISLLGTIAGAMITTAGVVFSLLVVSLQLASGQFSPRVLRGFWRDRYGQVLVGLLLSTFAFCVLALTRVDTSAELAPAFTVLFALVLTLASVVAIVVYLDRISRQQYVGRILGRVVGETLRLIDELPYGPHIGVRAGEPVPPHEPAEPPFVVTAPADGWVQQVSRRAVLAAVPHGSVVRLNTRVGAYVTRGAVFAMVWPVPPAADRPGIARLIAEAAIIGNARTMQQDIDFGLRQLNDIALRALSPAVNDPTTAIEVAVRLGSIMRPLLVAELPAQAVRDAHGRILLTPWDLEHVEYVRHAFDQIRLYAAPHPQVQQAVVRTLRMLTAACSTVEDRGAVLAELDRQRALAAAGTARAGLLPEDQARVAAAAAG